MADSVLVVAQDRGVRGSKEARRLRKKGLIPGVVYGHKEATVAITINGDEIFKVIRHGIRVVDLQAEGKVQKALIRDAQWDHLGKELLHVDFARIAADERVVITVPVIVRGTAPGVSAGGVLDQPIHSLSVECLAIQVPESIRVNVGELQLDGVIHVRDLVLPEGVKAMADPDAVVVHVTQKLLEPEPTAVAPAAEQAEPEIIGRQAKPEEEEGE
ncbi:MAG TPA: 50S ribosomal protein L25 [Gemmataceae bacterium]|jgi:large subunit ribosomal protein L25|nr:50S ribosomal protein L25 [Gemmataceae bacterium]